MLKRSITYTDFEDREQTDIYYFHLTKTELVAMEVEYDEGLDAWLRRIIATTDRKALIGEFKKIILMALGQKSADGKTFVKTDEFRQQFASSAAFDALFMELATDEKAAADFISGVLPKDVVAQSENPVLPPPNIRPAEEINAEK